MEYTYVFNENNSGGYTIVRTCLWRTPKWGVPNKYVQVIASNVNEAVAKFDKRFGINSDHESSYEWGSCSCCGRRFSIATDDPNAERTYEWKYTKVYYIADLSYYTDCYMLSDE